MPFKIVKINDHYRILKIKNNKLIKTKFKTKQKALNQAKNWLRFRHEKNGKLIIE